jgi:glyoxylase-like metal-dependent hydrolase (beta-lactamase superfamily II)
MLMTAPDAAIAFPHPVPPEPGQAIEVAPGILWARLALPFRLNHVNIYFIRDHDGWVAVDTGVADDTTRATWDALLEGPLRGAPLSALVVTHYHPDHVGLAGWLTERFGIPLHMPRTEYLFSTAITHRALPPNPDFYESHGLSAEAVGRVTGKGQGYLRMTTGLPSHFHRLRHGGTLPIGGRSFDILTAGGHAPEQAMLYCAEDKIFLSADQVLTKISPNISTEAMEPEANPLGEFLTSLAFLRETIPEDVLVLPGHHVPFTGLHVRAAELAAHHAGRCALIAEACRVAPRSAAELVPVVFERALDPQQMSFAFHEVVAHVNYMRGRRELEQFRDVDGILKTRPGALPLDPAGDKSPDPAT